MTYSEDRLRSPPDSFINTPLCRFTFQGINTHPLIYCLLRLYLLRIHSTTDFFPYR
eukprot:gene9246-6499_t